MHQVKYKTSNTISPLLPGSLAGLPNWLRVVEIEKLREELAGDPRVTPVFAGASSEEREIASQEAMTVAIEVEGSNTDVSAHVIHPNWVKFESS